MQRSVHIDFRFMKSLINNRYCDRLILKEDMKTEYRIYIAEDDKMLADEISILMINWGYQVKIAVHFDDLQSDIIEYNPHVVLMDINLPSFDGFHWCRKIREYSDIPVIYISSRDSSMDQIMGMNSGGDDYVIKPFDNSLLIAKLQAIIRRSYEYNCRDSQLLCRRGLTLDIGGAEAMFNGQQCTLTKNELCILKVLVEKEGSIVSREELMRGLWGDDIYVNDNTLTVNVNRVRLKLEELGLASFIETKKGLGYGIL